MSSASATAATAATAPFHSASAVSKYIPRIVSKTDQNGKLEFTIDRINVSLANALRRVILSDIPTLVFRVYPHSECRSTITVNTSRIHNQILNQRLSCIPIHITDQTFEFQDYQAEINATADGNEIRYVTTKDFRVKNKTNGKYLTDVKVHEIFPPNPITGDYIEFARLLPKMSEYSEGEQLAMTCDLDIGSAREDGMFNVVCTCAYSMTMDPAKVDEAWRIKEAELVKDGVAAIGSEEMKAQRKNWALLDAQRFTKEDSFDFVLRSAGVFTCPVIVKKACAIMQRKLRTFSDAIDADTVPILATEVSGVKTTMDNCYDIILENEDYTLGKALEFYLYENYYVQEKKLNFCAFKKLHPHDSSSRLRLAYLTNVSETNVQNDLKNACKDLRDVYIAIEKMF